MKRFLTKITTTALLATLLLPSGVSPAQADSLGSQLPLAPEVGGGRWTLSGGPVVQVVPSDGLNLRQGPGTDSTVLGIFSHGTLLRVLQTQGTWRQVQTAGGQIGWVHSEFVSSVGSAPVVARATMSKGSGILQMEVTGSFRTAGVSGDTHQLTVAIPDGNSPATSLPVDAYAVGSMSVDGQGVHVAFDAPYAYYVKESSPGRVLVQLLPADVGTVSIASQGGSSLDRPLVLQLDVPPVVLDGITLVPVRALAEWLGAKVSFNQAANTVVAVGQGHTVIMPVGAPAARVDGADKALPQPAFIHGGRTLVPLRFLSEAFGVAVAWQPTTHEIALVAQGRTAKMAVPDAPPAQLAAVRDSLRAASRSTEVSRGARRVQKSMQMRATAYAIGDGMTPSDTTATGLPAKRGVVAVDPSVIPLGTRLYIEGYGEAIAADTGGAIKGNRIDLCVDTVAEADAYGWQTVRVDILE